MIQVPYPNKDVLSKFFAERLKEESLAVYGADKEQILEKLVHLFSLTPERAAEYYKQFAGQYVPRELAHFFTCLNISILRVVSYKSLFNNGAFLPKTLSIHFRHHRTKPH